MSELDLTPIKQRLKAATHYSDDPTTNGLVIRDHHREMGFSDGDAAFFSHTPTDIAALIAEVERLRRWKCEAEIVMGEWEQLYESLGRPGTFGGSKAHGVSFYIGKLEGQLAHARMPRNKRQVIFNIPSLNMKDTRFDDD